MHGSVSLVLAEPAVSIGAIINSDLTKVMLVGIEINANRLRSFSRGKVTAEARPLYDDRTLSIWEIKINNDRQRTGCVSHCSLALRRGGVMTEK